MELALPMSLPYLLALLLLSILYLHKKLTHSKTKLPPGPWTLPFIGSLHHLATASLPHHSLRNLARVHRPVMLLRAGEINLIVITSREATKEVMKLQDTNFANRPAITAAKFLLYGCRDIVFSNGSYWRQMRRISTSELFSSKRVKSLSSIRQEEINSMLKNFSRVPENSLVNLSVKMSEFANNIIIHAAFGRTCKNRGKFLEILGEVVEFLAGFSFSDLFPSLSWLDVNTRRRLTRLHSELDLVTEEVLQEHLKQRKKEGEKEYDLLDVLVNIMESGGYEQPITLDCIKAVISKNDLFLAGTESLSTTIIWTMAELMKNPGIMAKVQAEMKQVPNKNGKLDHNAHSYLKQVIKETLRMHPVTPLLLPRQSIESNYYWNDPEEFKPERFETTDVDFKGQHFEFVPFGAGRRICPGLEFGMAVLEETLTSLLLHFDWKLPDGMKPENLDMTETSGLSAAKKDPLYLIPTMLVPLPDDRCR